MGERFDTFINSLSDHELAVYIGYQYESLLKGAKEQIDEEIEGRCLSKKQQKELFDEQLNNDESKSFCLRCGSNRFFNDVDIEFENSDHFTSEIEVITKRCRLCNYNPSKSSNRNLLSRIKQFFMGDPNKTKKKIKTYDWFGK